MTHPFHLIDVFHDGPLSGNPLAVVHAAEGLTSGQMQAATRWLNLSETTFVLPPTDPAADYRVRIFTLDREIPFAGHPTLGTCAAWLAAGGVPQTPGRVVQDCGVGLVDLRLEGEQLAFAAPPLLRGGPVDPQRTDEVLRFLGISPADVREVRWADNGPGWIGVLMHSAEAVLALNLPGPQPGRFDVGVVGPYPAGHPLAFEVRTFFSDQNGTTVEDPVTGSFNASAAQWLLGAGYAQAPYVAAQGTRLGRQGRIYVDRDAEGRVWVGGKAAVLMAGTASFARPAEVVREAPPVPPPSPLL